MESRSPSSWVRWSGVEPGQGVVVDGESEGETVGDGSLALGSEDQVDEATSTGWGGRPFAPLVSTSGETAPVMAWILASLLTIVAICWPGAIAPPKSKIMIRPRGRDVWGDFRALGVQKVTGCNAAAARRVTDDVRPRDTRF